MKIGNNLIEINVLAEDNITNKKYELTVYRRDKQEQIQYEKEIQYQAEKLSAILEEEQTSKSITNEKEQSKKNKFVWIIGLILMFSIIIIAKKIYLILKV